MSHIVGVPHFTTVPEAWKRPFGPYVKSPPSFGGDWYKVDPFTGPEPWRQEINVAEVLPEGFVDTFGLRPKSEDFRDAGNPSVAFRVATGLWEQDLKYFLGAGAPEWATAEELQLSKDTLVFWNMGSPRFYNGRYGFMTRFPAAIPYTRFEASAWGAIKQTHQEVSAFQIRLLQDGLSPPRLHPFVPPMFPRS